MILDSCRFMKGMLTSLLDTYRNYSGVIKLNYDNYPISNASYDMEFAKEWNRDKLIEYHVEFFRAGITALIKKWLSNGCKESPEDITNVIVTEYIKK